MAKNIILLSDGTGNSSSSPFKTNVWRLYQAIDIGDPPPGGLEQIVFYDNGVGTESFKPLALLGLAIGIGLAKNVKDLYTFLCRNYETGDNIFLFGFSRGAFTVRILAGLVLRCGIVKAGCEDELGERVKLAYAEYKRDVARRATATRPLLILGRLLGGHKTGFATDRITFNFAQQQEQLFPGITFLGVWDTVDAYGMPVDELKEGIDRYVWPMTLADRNLSDHIDRACHALSLDDERPTFRPVLWTDPINKPERLKQVWFAGVHANVGGGYPDDGLAFVTLQWMMDEAVQAGLRLYPEDRAECADQADSQGEQYDSRSGLAGYYRYGPRDVDALCADPDHGVTVARPSVHDSAIERIRLWQVAYAPVSFPSFPRGYQIFGRPPGGTGLAPLAAVESPGDLAGRAKDMEPVRDAIVRRRIAYGITVAFSAVLALLPAYDELTKVGFWHWAATSCPIVSTLLSPPVTAIAWLANALSGIPGWGFGTRWIGEMLKGVVDQGVLPGWASWWIDSFAGHPALFVFCALVVLWLFVRKSQQLQDQIFARAEYAWRRI